MHQSICECGSPDCPTDRGYFYTSIRNDAGEYRLLLGPFPVHADALRAVDVTREIVERIDRRAFWYAYGTARTETCIRPLFVPCGVCGEIKHYLAQCACQSRSERRNT